MWLLISFSNIEPITIFSQLTEIFTCSFSSVIIVTRARDLEDKVWPANLKTKQKYNYKTIGTEVLFSVLCSWPLNIPVYHTCVCVCVCVVVITTSHSSQVWYICTVKHLFLTSEFKVEESVRSGKWKLCNLKRNAGCLVTTLSQTT